MSVVAKARTTGGSRNKRPVHVVSSGRGRNRPAAGLPPKRPGPGPSAPASRPRPEEATAPRKPQSPKTPSKGQSERHADKRKGDKADRALRRSLRFPPQKTKGVTPEAIKNDPSLNKTEKKNMMVILEKAKKTKKEG